MSCMHRTLRPLRAGQSMVETLVITALVAILIAIGPSSPLESLVRAIGDAHGRSLDAAARP